MICTRRRSARSSRPRAVGDVDAVERDRAAGRLDAAAGSARPASTCRSPTRRRGQRLAARRCRGRRRRPPRSSPTARRRSSPPAIGKSCADRGPETSGSASTSPPAAAHLAAASSSRGCRRTGARRLGPAVERRVAPRAALGAHVGQRGAKRQPGGQLCRARGTLPSMVGEAPAAVASSGSRPISAARVGMARAARTARPPARPRRCGRRT